MRQQDSRILEIEPRQGSIHPGENQVRLNFVISLSFCLLLRVCFLVLALINVSIAVCVFLL